MRGRHPVLRAAGAGALLALAGLAAGALWLWTRDYDGYFQERRGRLVSVRTVEEGQDPAAGRSWVTLGNDRGFTVDCGILAPRLSGPGRRFPAVVLLGGKATGKRAVDYALGVAGAVIAAPEYPFAARDSYTVAEFIGDIPQIRRGLIDMVPAVMLTLDYLASRPDVDTSRIILLGYSFGAPFVPVVMAHDRRPDAAVMVYGGGEMRTLIGHNIARHEGQALGAAGGLLSAVLLRPLEPLRYAAAIAPVPALMINGTEDEQVPRRNAELLYGALREPKKIVWIESRHVHPDAPALTRTILAALERELRAMGMIP